MRLVSWCSWLLLTLSACGAPYGSLRSLDDAPLGDDADSNVLRVRVGSVHDVEGVVGSAQGPVTASFRAPVEALTARDPSLLLVEPLGATTFRLTALHEGETVLHLLGDGEERLLPIKILPAEPPP